GRAVGICERHRKSLAIPSAPGGWIENVRSANGAGSIGNQAGPLSFPDSAIRRPGPGIRRSVKPGADLHDSRVRTIALRSLIRLIFGRQAQEVIPWRFRPRKMVSTIRRQVERIDVVPAGG